MTTDVTTIDPVAIASEQFAHMEKAWNEADGHAFADVFADDAHFVDIRGAHHRGRAEIAGGHQGIFDSVYAGSTVRYRVDVARTIAPGCIHAVVSGTLDVPAGPVQGIHPARITAILTNQGDRWAVVAFHNTLVVDQP
jgi:uncharacterized protein (TIGR02246 family)